MAIGTPVGSAFLNVQPQLGAGFQAAIASKINPIMGVAALGAGAVLAGGVAAGFALANIGETFDEAFDQIRTGTGAIGTELEGLQEDFKAVFASVPTDANLAATAITEVQRRLGLTGGELQGTAAQFLELTRITGGDLETNIAEVTRAFGDWGITVDDQGERLDQLFRANQETGISVDQLAGTLVKFGAPLRQLGFNFDQSAALIANFEREGVNAELVLGSMRIALGKMARAGEPAQETFQRVVESIKTAGSVSEANAMALELFGARAGPDMAAAIREGRFEVEELYQAIGFGTDTVRGAAEDTNDWRESLNILKNRVLVALEPLATKVFGAIGNAVEAATPFVEKVVTWLADALPKAFAVIGPIVGQVFSGIKGFFSGVGDAASGGGVQSALGSIVSFFQNMITNIRTVIDVVVPIIRQVVGGIIEAFQNNREKIMKIVSSIGKILEGLGDIITTIFNAIRSFWEEWGDEITALISNAFNTIVGIIDGVVQVISGIVDVIAGILTGDWKRVWEGAKNIVGGIVNAIVSIINGAVGQWAAVFGDFFTNLANSFKRGVDTAVGFFRELPGRILDFLKSLPGKILQIGKDIVSGLIDGIKDLPKRLLESLTSGISNALNGVKDFFGIGSPSKVMARLIGMPLAEGIITGYKEALEPRALLATTRKAVDAITLAAMPTIAVPTFTGGIDGNLALASGGGGFGGGPAIENVNFYDTREKPAEESLQEAGLRVAVMLNLRK